MNHILDLDGKQIVITSDDRSPTVWLQICSDRSSKGVQLTKKEAMDLRRALFDAVYVAIPE